jgi:hydrogenase maturation protease
LIEFSFLWVGVSEALPSGTPLCSLDKNVHMKTLVVGIGNPILGDDGVGWVVAEEVKKLLPPDSSVDVDCLSLGGISLMERLIGYDRAILVDAFVCDDESGTILVSRLEELPNYSAFHLTSVHDMSLQNAMKLGRQMGAKLPDEVSVVGISARQIYDFGEELSHPVQEAVPKATQIVMELLAQNIIIH